MLRTVSTVASAKLQLVSDMLELAFCNGTYVNNATDVFVLSWGTITVKNINKRLGHGILLHIRHTSNCMHRPILYLYLQHYFLPAEVFVGGSAGKWGRLSHPSWLLGATKIVILAYLFTVARCQIIKWHLSSDLALQGISFVSAQQPCLLAWQLTVTHKTPDGCKQPGAGREKG